MGKRGPGKNYLLKSYKTSILLKLISNNINTIKEIKKHIKNNNLKISRKTIENQLKYTEINKQIIRKDIQNRNNLIDMGVVNYNVTEYLLNKKIVYYIDYNKFWHLFLEKIYNDTKIKSEKEIRSKYIYNKSEILKKNKQEFLSEILLRIINKKLPHNEINVSLFRDSFNYYLNKKNLNIIKVFNLIRKDIEKGIMKINDTDFRNIEGSYFKLIILHLWLNIQNTKINYKSYLLNKINDVDISDINDLSKFSQIITDKDHNIYKSPYQNILSTILKKYKIKETKKINHFCVNEKALINKKDFLKKIKEKLIKKYKKKVNYVIKLIRLLLLKEPVIPIDDKLILFLNNELKLKSKDPKFIGLYLKLSLNFDYKNYIKLYLKLEKYNAQTINN